MGIRLGYIVMLSISLACSLAARGGDDLLLDDADSPSQIESTMKGAQPEQTKEKAQEAGAEKSLHKQDELLLEESQAQEGSQQAGSEPRGDGLQQPEEVAKTADKFHANAFAEDIFPPATACKICHEKQYREWSVSQHAYSILSPIFNSAAGTVLKATSGTNGDFCYRCHVPIGMNLGEPLFMSTMDRPAGSREGITCVFCHRMSKPYGKVDGRVALDQGDITQPVAGPTGNEGLKKVLADSRFNVVTDKDARGRKIHGDVKKFFYLTQPGFCGICHETLTVDGMRIDETYAEYLHSPAAQRGETCQTCHMGKIPGKSAGFDHGPAAKVGGVETPPRKLSNHMFVGPDYSVIHPGLFPHNPKAAKMANMREWLTFNYKAGWGTDAFENHVPEGYVFPERWASVDDRYEAREIIDEQLKLLEEAKEQRKTLLQNGYRLGDIVTEKADQGGIKFKVEFRNGTDGHHAPSGFERKVFFDVTVVDSEGKVLLRSGDLDPNGDVRDLLSDYIRNGELPLDDQLFQLQQKFIMRNAYGGEREQVLPVNFTLDPLPYVRPDPGPSILLGRPLKQRVHRVGVAPGDHRWAEYHVDGKALEGSKPPYKAKVKLIAGSLPVNLVNAIKLVGYDYNMSPRQVAEAVVEGYLVLWERELVLDANRPFLAAETAGDK